MTITLTDQDDDGSITLSSDPPSAGTTVTATLEDQDGVKAGVAVTWLWEISSDQNTWTPISDATTNSYTPGTDDIGDYLRVTATYEDELDAGKTAQTKSGAILTAPPTNLQPSFTDPTATRTVAENTPAGQPIGEPVAAAHLDSVGTLTYSLGGTDASSFDIDSSTGQLKTKGVFNYEIDSTSYFVTVSVGDSLDDYSHADAVEDSSIGVTITVTDANEPPQFADDALTTLEISEDTTIGVGIGEYEATDPDLSDTVTYSVSGKDAALFQVDSIGQLQVKEALDYEDGDTLTVVVSATDSRDDSGTTEQTPLPDDTITVTVTLTNVFEAPRFNDDDGSGTTTRSVPENTEADQPVGAPVSATDDENDTLTYRLGGTDDTFFAIDTTTGQIKTNAALDHEIKDTYSVIVWVGDGKDSNGDADDPFQDDTSIEVTIEVTDLNEKPAFDSNLDATPSIAENTVANTDIGTPLSATDEDENETLTYGLNGTDASTFDIDANGQIKTKAALDHENKETYTVTVTVRDSRDDNGEADTDTDARIDVTITVTDEDDPGTITLSSQQPVAGETLTATLDDDDGVKTDVDVTWVWYSSLDKNTWTVIVGADTNTYIPQEEDENKYLKVTALYEDELGSGKTAEAETQGMVHDRAPTNELPSFNSGLTTTLSIQENTPAGENIGDPFTASDADGGETLTYLLGGTDSAEFAIVDTTGQIQTKEVLDYENANNQTSYSVTVEVRDSKDPFGNADTRVDDTIDVTINVTDMLVPDVPEEPTVSATQGAAAGLTATWAAIEPEDDSPVDGYDVQYRVKDATPPDWGSANVTVTGVTATITGLEYSATYEVEVRSKNTEGESDWSPSGEGTIPSSLSVSFSPGSQIVNEGSNATFTVTVSPAADRELSIPISATRGTAEADDYSVSGLTNGNLTFADTESSKTFTVSTTNDSDRNDETVNLAFGQLPAAIGVGSQATASLTINDTTPAPRTNNGGSGGDGTLTQLNVVFSPAIQTVNEGSSATFTVTVDPATDRALDIPIAISSTNAEPGDYSPTTTTVSFASGDTSKTLKISTTDDSDRDHETLSISFGQLPASVGAGSQSTATLTINDTTPAPHTNPNNGGGTLTRLNVTISPASRRVNEGSSGTFTVNVDPAADRALNIPITISSTNAEPGDYSPTTTTVSFASGDTSKTLKISTTDDSDRDHETLSISFGQLPASVGAGSQSTATLTINDTTPAPRTNPNNGGGTLTQLNVTISPASRRVNEGSSGTFTVNVDPAADRALNIPITISSTNAESGDYSPASTTVSFASGDATKTFTISTKNDSDRDDETVDLAFGQLPVAVGTGTQSTTQLTINDTTLAPRSNSGGGGGGGGGGALSKGGSSGGGGGSNNYRRSSSQVYISPAYNNAPVFTEGDNTHRSVAENSGSSATIGSPVSATDADNDTLTYHLGGLDGASFSINPKSGQLPNRLCIGL